MISWLLNKYEDWKFERKFQKRKAELMKLDPFIYDLPENEKKEEVKEFPVEKY